MTTKLLSFRAALPSNDNVLRRSSHYAPMPLDTKNFRGTANPPRLDAPQLPPPTTAPAHRPADVSRVFDSVVRLAVAPRPHPMWNVCCALGRGLERFLGALQTILLAYYALLGLAAIPLLATQNYVGGILMAIVGGFFWFLLVEKVRTRRHAPGMTRRGDERVASFIREADEW
jgi:hypothetical protein